MAVTKIWAIHDSVSRVVDYCTNPSKTKLSDLEQVLLYAADKEKTLDEGEPVSYTHLDVYKRQPFGGYR